MNIKTFANEKQINYKERHCENVYIKKYYEIENTGADVVFYTIPDACIDLQFTEKEGKSIIYGGGSFLSSQQSQLSDHQWCFAVKFNQGKYPLIVRDKISQLIEGSILLTDFPWLETLADRIRKAKSFERRVEIFEKEFPLNTQFQSSNHMVDIIMEKIEDSHGCISIAEIAQDMQYNQKYLGRVFHEVTGLTMKKYATIIRMQTAFRYLQEKRIDDIYEKLGYYDQSYFIKKFKDYTSMTPRQYCKSLGLDVG